MSESISRGHENDLISRREAIDALKDMYHAAEKWGAEASDDVIKARAESCMASLVEMKLRIEKLPPAQPKQHEIGYSECANAMLKMWIDNVLTDGEYNRIMGKLNEHWRMENG